MGEKQFIEISPKTILWAVLIIVSVVAIYLVRDIIAVLLFAIIIAAAIEPLLTWGESKKVPRLLSLIVIYLLFFVLFAAFIYIVLPLMLDEFSDFLKNYQIYFGKLEEAIGTVTFIPGLSTDTHELLVQLTERIPSLTSLVSYASAVFGGVSAFFIVVVVSFYLALSKEALDNFLKSIMPVQYEAYVLDLFRRSQKKMGRWLYGQLLLSLIMAAVVFVGLLILGVKYAFLASLMVAIFEIVPFVGPIISGAIIVLVALSQSSYLGLSTLIFFLVAQQMENHLLVPLLTKKLIGLNPVAVILAILVGAKLGGILGILLAVPLAAVVDEFFDDLAKRKRNAPPLL